jgi:hypothetical protein
LDDCQGIDPKIANSKSSADHNRILEGFWQRFPRNAAQMLWQIGGCGRQHVFIGAPAVGQGDVWGMHSAKLNQLDGLAVL